MKRSRSETADEDDRRNEKRTKEPVADVADLIEPANGVPAEGNSDDEEQLLFPKSTTKSAQKRGAECPYLDTVSRENLDFDFEKCCSVSLIGVNVYVCLVCGKYFQVYCLPDNYEVMDRSLDDIRHVLSPNFTQEEISRMDQDVKWTRTLDGTEYMPGLVGMNNMKNNEYANVILQVLARVTPIRDFFLEPSKYTSCKSVLVQRTGELIRKMWNTRNFKGQVSPHEFMQAVMLASKKQYTIDKQSDPVDFFAWLVNTLHMDLTGNEPKKRSIITDCFQGKLRVVTEAGTGKGKAAKAMEDVEETIPFMLLGLDLPPPPLFKDALEKNIIPQVPIFNIMQKYDGQTINDDIRAGRRRFTVVKLPRYLALHMRRFTKNNFFMEKNPTIVNFPVKNLELKDIIPVPTAKSGKPLPSKYDLVGNVVHDGKAGEGTYRAHIHRKVEQTWYEVQDLRVTDILPQMVALSEAYFQVYELKQQ